MTPEFKHLKNHYRRIRLKNDELILEQMLVELKDKHDQERRIKISELKQQIKKLGG